MYNSQPPAYTPAQVHQPGHGPQLYPPYPQPQHPSPHQPDPQQTTVIIQQTNPIVMVGSGPTRTMCPSCRAEVITSVKHSANCKTHTFALILFCFICWPCVCIPYCMDSCQSAKHYCPNCNAYIGEFAN